jgi:hypothetical protein
LYRDYNNANDKHFSGKMSQLQVREIRQLVEWSKPTRILDYGSGKGFQYLEKRLHEHWGGVLPYCYDPGVVQIGRKPDGKFTGVICTDVMEHIDPDDVDEILGDIFGSLYLTGLVWTYFHISTRPAGKTFEDGENVHLCVRPESWWNAKLDRFNSRADLIIRATYGD